MGNHLNKVGAEPLSDVRSRDPTLAGRSPTLKGPAVVTQK